MDNTLQTITLDIEVMVRKDRQETNIFLWPNVSAFAFVRGKTKCFKQGQSSFSDLTSVLKQKHNSSVQGPNGIPTSSGKCVLRFKASTSSTCFASLEKVCTTLAATEPCENSATPGLLARIVRSVELGSFLAATHPRLE